VNDRFDTGSDPARTPRPRKVARVALQGEVSLRRSSQLSYRVSIHDVSPHGCRLEFVERPKLDERVWVKFQGLEAIEALVCWVEGFVAGVEFEKSIHPAVFDQLLARMK
jgi:hypothetical protein